MEIINPLTGKSSSYVKNSAHFVEGISDAPIHSNQMVSLDVVSLFTVEITIKMKTIVRKTLMIKNQQASSQKFRQLISVE